MALDRAWHLANRMPARPSEAERIAWHLAHAAACGCRPIPPRLAERMRALGVEPPVRPEGVAKAAAAAPPKRERPL
jgi:hypothetical protein